MGITWEHIQIHLGFKCAAILSANEDVRVLDCDDWGYWKYILLPPWARHRIELWEFGHLSVYPIYRRKHESNPNQSPS